MAEEKDGPLTVEEVCKAHAEFGRLDKSMVKKGMGANWYAAGWHRVHPDIFEPESR